MKPPKLKTAYDIVPFILSIMTRSIVPILVSLAPYTAVPSTLSLPTREPVSLASVTIVAPPWLKTFATSGAKDCSCEQGPAKNASSRNLRRFRDLFDERNRQVRHVR